MIGLFICTLYDDETANNKLYGHAKNLVFFVEIIIPFG